MAGRKKGANPLSVAIASNNPQNLQALIGEAVLLPIIKYDAEDIIGALQSLVKNTSLSANDFQEISRRLFAYSRFFRFSLGTLFGFHEVLNTACQQLREQKTVEDVLRRCHFLEMMFNEFEMNDAFYLWSNQGPLREYLLKTLSEKNYSVTVKLLKIFTDKRRKPSVGTEESVGEILHAALDENKSETNVLFSLTMDYLRRADRDLRRRVFIQHNAQGQTPLVAASAKHRWDDVAEMISICGVLPNEKRDDVGYGFVLSEACRNNQINIVRSLLANNAPMDGNADEIIQSSMLSPDIKKLINTAKKEKRLFAILKELKEFEHVDDSIKEIKELLAERVSANCRNHFGLTPLMAMSAIPMKNFNKENAEKFFKEVIKLFVQHNANFSVLSKKSPPWLHTVATPIGVAAKHRNWVFLKTLCECELIDKTERDKIFKWVQYAYIECPLRRFYLKVNEVVDPFFSRKDFVTPPTTVIPRASDVSAPKPSVEAAQPVLDKSAKPTEVTPSAASPAPAGKSLTTFFSKADGVKTTSKSNPDITVLDASVESTHTIIPMNSPVSTREMEPLINKEERKKPGCFSCFS